MMKDLQKPGWRMLTTGTTKRRSTVVLHWQVLIDMGKKKHGMRECVDLFLSKHYEKV